MSTSIVTFPPSESAVRVRMMNPGAVMTVKAESFVKPVQKGHELLNLTCTAYLIEHESSGKKVMFDLGVRKDWWNLSPVIHKRLGSTIPGLRVDTDVPEILKNNGISLDSISSVIWSHYHWDHVGDMSLFPHSTEIVVGAGFKDSTVGPGYPEKEDSPLRSSDFKERHLNVIDFTKSPSEIGGFAAHDFFGDGSFYILDTPGHCLGHMCGLARTTGGKNSTFLLLGGDICHFVGDLRPNKSYPLPDPIPNDVLDKDSFFPTPCPCSIFTDHHPILSDDTDVEERRTTPWYQVSDHEKSAYVDPPAAQSSVDKLVGFERCPNVLICLSHDSGLLRYLPTLNSDPKSDLNSWRKNNWKEETRWEWLNELPRDGKPGRKPIVEGLWRDGKPSDRT
ncbi:beta-lactamase-like protein [Exophiala viscosa]|uniref:beta-lactamase-like protein n=1 Tax=Exophiala viscosa TaxID=2486360 RepID=UPI002194D5E3|nr:beta-lactamase-like protein [Exophiala viscosa]